MKLIITATNRENSLTFQTAQIVESIYKKQNDESIEILDLKEVPFSKIIENPYNEKSLGDIKPYLDKIAKAESLIIICPEYNGGIPGLIKHFIDHWHYPESFVYKPVCFIGLGGKFGALRPVEHLQNIFLYRHSFVFPIRVFIQNIHDILIDGVITDKNIQSLLEKQSKGFIKFTKAISSTQF